MTDPIQNILNQASQADHLINHLHRQQRLARAAITKLKAEVGDKMTEDQKKDLQKIEAMDRDWETSNND